MALMVVCDNAFVTRLRCNQNKGTHLQQQGNRNEFVAGKTFATFVVTAMADAPENDIV